VASDPPPVKIIDILTDECLNKELMIETDNNYLSEFSKHFNARLLSSDFADNISSLVEQLNKKEQEEKKHLVLLSCKSDLIFNQLVEFNYEFLLKKILNNVQIMDEMKDNFLSEMDINLFNFYKKYLNENISEINIVINQSKKSFEIHCPKLIMELIFSVTAGFHNSVVLQLEHFNKIINLRTKFEDNGKINLFINSRTESAFAYFVISYLAEKLQIPLNY
jgi:hypothetical protein